MLPVLLGERETRERRAAEHHLEDVPVGKGVVPVDPPQQSQVGYRIVGELDEIEQALETCESVVHDLPHDRAHAAEVRIHGHRRCACLRGQPASGQAAGTSLRDQPGGGIDQGGSVVRVLATGAHP